MKDIGKKLLDGPKTIDKTEERKRRRQQVSKRTPEAPQRRPMQQDTVDASLTKPRQTRTRQIISNYGMRGPSDALHKFACLKDDPDLEVTRWKNLRAFHP